MFTCTYCDCSFSTLGNLQRHERTTDIHKRNVELVSLKLHLAELKAEVAENNVTRAQCAARDEESTSLAHKGSESIIKELRRELHTSEDRRHKLEKEYAIRQYLQGQPTFPLHDRDSTVKSTTKDGEVEMRALSELGGVLLQFTHKKMRSRCTDFDDIISIRAAALHNEMLSSNTGLWGDPASGAKERESVICDAVQVGFLEPVEGKDGGFGLLYRVFLSVVQNFLCYQEPIIRKPCLAPVSAFTQPSLKSQFDEMDIETEFTIFRGARVQVLVCPKAIVNGEGPPGWPLLVLYNAMMMNRPRLVTLWGSELNAKNQTSRTTVLNKVVEYWTTMTKHKAESSKVLIEESKSADAVREELNWLAVATKLDLVPTFLPNSFQRTRDFVLLSQFDIPIVHALAVDPGVETEIVGEMKSLKKEELDLNLREQLDCPPKLAKWLRQRTSGGNCVTLFGMSELKTEQPHGRLFWSDNGSLEVLMQMLSKASNNFTCLHHMSVRSSKWVPLKPEERRSDTLRCSFCEVAYESTAQYSLHEIVAHSQEVAALCVEWNLAQGGQSCDICSEPYSKQACRPSKCRKGEDYHPVRGFDQYRKASTTSE